MQDCRREGERRVISWAGELRWRQSSSRSQRGEWKEGVLFGFLGIERAERRRMRLSSALPGEPLLSGRWAHSCCLLSLDSSVTLRRRDGGHILSREPSPVTIGSLFRIGTGVEIEIDYWLSI